MTAAARVVGAAVCVGAAVFLVLIALDAHAWSSRLPADDLRYRRDASAGALWKPDELTGGVARSILGIGDDLAYRRALRDFRLGRVTEPVAAPLITNHRIAAQVELTHVADASRDSHTRSQLDNLLGVLGFGLGSQDYGQRKVFYDNAITAFRSAVVLDPGNDDAFFNLEFALDQVRSTGEQQAQGSSQLGHRGHAGLKPPGRGY
ncbi:MAG TPA: hypothetical protein VE269_07180 [Gaiellaceae bacterium]|nr:hypothetical protein [Gaiellaceae bacterium]